MVMLKCRDGKGGGTKTKKDKQKRQGIETKKPWTSQGLAKLFFKLPGMDSNHE
jgi:hypothetical protein